MHKQSENRMIINILIIDVVCLICILMVPKTFFPLNLLRMIASIPFLLFLPGYCILECIMPKEEPVQSIKLLAQRAVFSIALSLAIIPIYGLALNLIGLKISFDSVLISTELSILLTLSIRIGAQMSKNQIE
jgi:uncharacterized membrane protein